MTLHIAFICPTFIVTVGDRRLSTRSANGQIDVWDPYANKTVVVVADNGIAAVSYAGLGHMGRLQTDQWLLDRLLGPGLQRSPRDAHGHRAMVTSGPRLRLNLQDVIQRVSTGIRFDLPRQNVRPSLRYLEVQIVGWTWPHDVLRRPSARASTYTWTVITQQSGTRLKIHTSAAERYMENCPIRAARLESIGAPHPAVLQSIADRLQARQAGQITPDDVEKELVEGVREAAQSDPTIGTDLVACYLPPPGSLTDPRIQFHWQSSQAAEAFTPAILHTLGYVMEPTRFNQTHGPQVPYAVINGEQRSISIEVVPAFSPKLGPSHFSAYQRRRR